MTSREMWIAIGFWAWVLSSDYDPQRAWILGDGKSLFNPGRAPRTVLA